jgi:hypothetical protein
MTDFCQVPLAGLRDEGPLVLSAGWLNSASDAGDVGVCGPHTVVPRLFAMRFGVELAVHGCTHALAEARSCTITDQITHSLLQLWDRWVEQRNHCSAKLAVAEGHGDLWPLLSVFHDFDPGSTSTRYPKLLPEGADACALLTQACGVVVALVDETLKCVPKTKADCRRRLIFLKQVAENPGICLPDGPAAIVL